MRSLASIAWERSQNLHLGALPRQPTTAVPHPRTQRSDRENITTHHRRRSRRRSHHRPHRHRMLGWRWRKRGRSRDSHARHVQRLRLHRRAPRAVHGGDRTSRSSTTRRQRRTTPAPTTSRSSARAASPTSRRSRSTGSPRPCSTPTCSRRSPRMSKGRWLDWKEAAATDADGNLIALRHRHRPAGHLLPRRPVRGRRPADRPRRRSQRCSTATGTTTSTSPPSTRRAPASR